MSIPKSRVARENQQYVQGQSVQHRREQAKARQSNEPKNWQDESKDVVSQYIECPTHPLLVKLTDCYRQLENAYYEGLNATSNWSLRHGNLIERFTPENEGKIRTRQWDYAAACTRCYCAIERIHMVTGPLRILLQKAEKLVKKNTICLDESDAVIDNESRCFDYREHKVALINITCAVELIKLSIDILSRLNVYSPGHDVEFTLHQRCRSALQCLEVIPQLPKMDLNENRRNYWKHFCAFFGKLVSSAWSSLEGPDHPCFSMSNSSNTLDEQSAQFGVQAVLNKCKGWSARMQKFNGRQIDPGLEPGLEVKYPKAIRRIVQGSWWQNKLCGW